MSSAECGSGMFVAGIYCEPCPRHHYNEENNRVACEECPSGTRTTGIGSTSSSDCLGMHHSVKSVNSVKSIPS